jgi:hypothetical protein
MTWTRYIGGGGPSGVLTQTVNGILRTEMRGAE